MNQWEDYHKEFIIKHQIKQLDIIRVDVISVCGSLNKLKMTIYFLFKVGYIHTQMIGALSFK